MDLLKRFDERHPSWRLTSLAREAGLHKATAYRLLAALEKSGMLARDLFRADVYRLGPEAMALGARAQRGSDLTAASHPELVVLAASCGETVTLEVASWPDIVIIDEVLGPRLVGSRPSIGTRWPAHATSTGKAILSTMGKDAVVQTLGRKLKRLTPATFADHDALARELGETRRRGWAVAMDEIEVGYTAVGAVVRSSTGRVLGAISAGGPTERFNPPKRLASYGAQVKRAAGLISERLGWAMMPDLAAP